MAGKCKFTLVLSATGTGSGAITGLWCWSMKSWTRWSGSSVWFGKCSSKSPSRLSLYSRARASASAAAAFFLDSSNSSSALNSASLRAIRAASCSISAFLRAASCSISAFLRAASWAASCSISALCLRMSACFSAYARLAFSASALARVFFARLETSVTALLPREDRWLFDFLIFTDLVATDAALRFSRRISSAVSTLHFRISSKLMKESKSRKLSSDRVFFRKSRYVKQRLRYSSYFVTISSSMDSMSWMSSGGVFVVLHMESKHFHNFSMFCQNFSFFSV